MSPYNGPAKPFINLCRATWEASMGSHRITLILVMFVICSLVAKAVAQEASPAKEVTFNRDVAPILYRNCVVCHRPNDIAPMPLITYKDTRPWAQPVREAVVQRKMPPW